MTRANLSRCIYLQLTAYLYADFVSQYKSANCQKACIDARQISVLAVKLPPLETSPRLPKNYVYLYSTYSLSVLNIGS